LEFHAFSSADHTRWIGCGIVGRSGDVSYRGAPMPSSSHKLLERDDALNHQPARSHPVLRQYSDRRANVVTNCHVASWTKCSGRQR